MNNRSMPPGSVIPELAYADVREAAAWLCKAFGFTERLRIADHRVQLRVGDGSIVVMDGGSTASGGARMTHRVMVRVDDVDAHYRRAKQHGARVGDPPKDHPFGERQYSAEDLGGHHWTFSQSIADVDPAEWGGTLLS